MLEKDEPDADAMWEDETAWAAEQVAMPMDDTELPMPVLKEEEKTDGKSVQKNDVDWQEAKHSWGIWMQQNGVRRKK